MTKERTMQGRIGRLQRLLARLNGNREELPQLELSRARFEELLSDFQDASDRQAAHTAGKQEATQQLRSLLAEAERMATILRLSVKQHYGIRAEKLADFGLQPFRGLPRRGSPAPGPQPPEPEPMQPAPIEADLS